MKHCVLFFNKDSYAVQTMTQNVEP